MTVVLADHNSTTRARLKRRLQRIRGIAVVGEASEVGEVTAMILNRKPDLVILDSQLKNGSSVEVLHFIEHLSMRPTILVVTSLPSQELRSACAIAGVDFFFEKSIEDHKIISTVRSLCGPESGLVKAGTTGSSPG
ncbi:response regulator [Petrachloros mirabilis]